MVSDAELILAAGAVLAASIGAAAVAARLRLPALVLFAGLGMVIGTDGLGWIDFADSRLARLIGTIALVVILFEGGSAAGWSRLRPVLRPAALLAVIGTIATAVVIGIAAWWLFDLSLLEGLLLGAILAATDGAAVFALMRRVHLPARIRQTVEGESGLNDPVAVLLVLVMIASMSRPGYDVGDAITFLVREVGIGAAVGAGGGAIVAAIAGRATGLPAGLVSVGTLAAAALAYGAAGSLDGSGFLAVYIVGLAVGDARLPDRESVLAFHQGLALIAEIGMFFALGLLVFPSQFGGIVVGAVALALITALVARPIAAWLATWRQGFTSRERIVIAWAGLRGAVPLILATFAVIDGVPRGDELLNVVFVAVLVSATLQGLTIEPLAGRLLNSACQMPATTSEQLPRRLLRRLITP